MYVVGSDSDPEDDFAPTHQARRGESSSVLSAKDAACIAIHRGLPRQLTSAEPPWLAALLERQASSSSSRISSSPGEEHSDEATYAATPRTVKAVEGPRGGGRAADAQAGGKRAGAQVGATPTQPPRRGRRNSITQAIMSVLRPSRPHGGSAADGGDGSTRDTGHRPDVAACLQDALSQAGFGRAVDADFADTVQSGSDRVPRLLWTLGQALREAGGMDEPRIFLHSPAPGDLLRELWRLGLADPPLAVLPGAGHGGGAAAAAAAA
eukprot:COSAG01_NODE_16825_length_1200_cov_28.735695_1_plen_265_part_10